MRRALVIAALAAVVAALALLAWRRDLPDVEIRYAPRVTSAGRIFPGHALGQGFRCEFDGLHALDVALVPLDGVAPSALELALRVGAPDGPVLRRASAAAESLPRSDGWARFEFETIVDSANVAFWFELASAAPSSHRPWVRYRGVTHVVRPWGQRVFDERVQEGDLLPAPPRPLPPDVLFDQLSAVAFAADGLDGAAGPATLVLSDPTSGAELRRAELAPRAPIASGWAFFAFEPLPDTRWRTLHYRLELPAGARLVGDADGHSLVLFHAAGELATDALGATCRGERLPDRDLVFRAWSSGGAQPLFARLASRAGWPLAFGALFWLGAIAVLVRAWPAGGRAKR